MSVIHKQLAGLVRSDAWAETVGKWLLEGRESAIREMSGAEDIGHIHAARGVFRAYDSLIQRINSLLEEGERLRLKELEKTKGDL
jgi:hypothetical protein